MTSEKTTIKEQLLKTIFSMPPLLSQPNKFAQALLSKRLNFSLGCTYSINLKKQTSGNGFILLMLLGIFVVFSSCVFGEGEVVGKLDTASALAFAGKSLLKVAVLYDQSGRENHLTQTVAASQPSLYLQAPLVAAAAKAASTTPQPETPALSGSNP